MTTDDLLGKVFETDVWLDAFLRDTPVVFQVYSISGDDVRVAVAPADQTARVPSKAATQSVSLETLTRAITEGTVHEWDGSPLRF